MTLLLCCRHGVRTEDFFSKLLPLPESESPEPEDAGTPLSASQIPQTVGKGDQCYFPNEVLLKRMTAYQSFVDSKF